MCMLRSPRIITFMFSATSSVTHSVNSSRNAALVMFAAKYGGWYISVIVMSVLLMVIFHSAYLKYVRVLDGSVLVFIACLVTMASQPPFPVGDV